MYKSAGQANFFLLYCLSPIYGSLYSAILVTSYLVLSYSNIFLGKAMQFIAKLRGMDQSAFNYKVGASLLLGDVLLWFDRLDGSFSLFGFVYLHILHFLCLS